MYVLYMLDRCVHVKLMRYAIRCTILSTVSRHSNAETKSLPSDTICIARVRVRVRGLGIK